MNITDMSMKALSDALVSGALTSVAITEAFLNRIESIDEKVGAYLTVDREGALKKAAEVDEKRVAGEVLGIYAGVPIAIKDNICTDGIRTTCASKMLENFVPPYDATVMKKIKDADMVVLGKLNMDEFAMGSSTENSAMQLTRNPWNLDYVPGGSSGGSAAAVAAKLAPLALGSDTGGSIRQPAHYCGVVGVKPTYGRVSRFGLIAFASSLDQIGPLTNTVYDAAMAMNLICGYDRYDSSSAPVEVPDFTKALTGDITGLKVALPKPFVSDDIHVDVKNALMGAVEVLKKAGATVELVDMGMTDFALPSYYLISSAEASSNLARFDGIKYGHQAEKFDDLLDLYKQTRDEGFGTEVKRRIMLGTYALSSGYYDAYYKKAQQVRTLIKDEFDRIFADYDVVLTPTGPTTAFKIGDKVDNPIEMYLNDICTVPINIAGLPALSINSGFDGNNLPIGIQFIAKGLDEGTMLNVAYAYEQRRELVAATPAV